MIQTLLLISRWIGQAHDHWRASTAGRRPMAAEIDLLHERLEQVRSENEILRTRLLRLAPRLGQGPFPASLRQTFRRA